MSRPRPEPFAVASEHPVPPPVSQCLGSWERNPREGSGTFPLLLHPHSFICLLLRPSSYLSISPSHQSSQTAASPEASVRRTHSYSLRTLQPTEGRKSTFSSALFSAASGTVLSTRRASEEAWSLTTSSRPPTSVTLTDPNPNIPFFCECLSLPPNWFHLHFFPKSRK